MIDGEQQPENASAWRQAAGAAAKPENQAVLRTGKKGIAGGVAIQQAPPAAQEGAEPAPQAVSDEDMARILDAWVSARLAVLRAEALRIAEAFEADNRAEEALQHRSQRGRLTVRVRDVRARQATPGSFTIDWCRYYFVTLRDGPRYRLEYLQRGAGDRYPMRSFAGVIRRWQRPLVTAAEEAFARIRAEAREVAAVRNAYRAAQRRQRAREDREVDRRLGTRE